MRVIGVDEHVWRHTPYGDKYVTVVLDLTPIRDRSGPSRLLDMVSGRSKKVFKAWLASQPDTWRECIEIVAMDGFTGFKSAAAEELPGARAVMDPFHVVHLAGNALDECRRRIQQELHHRRGRATDPLYKARRMLHTRSCLLTARQHYQILDLFSSDEHVALEVTWSVYQNIIDAYRSSNARGGKTLMHEEIARLTSTGMPSSLTELTTLGRTLKRRAGASWPTSITPTPATAPPKLSTAASNTYAAPPSDSETSATTSPERSSRPADSNPNYTPNYEEPVNGAPFGSLRPSATILLTASGLDRRTLLRGPLPLRQGSLGIPRVLCASAPQTDPQLSPQASGRATPPRNPAAQHRSGITLWWYEPLPCFLADHPQLWMISYDLALAFYG